VRLKPREVALVVGRVRDRQITVDIQAVGEQVVEHAAVLAAQHGILSPAHLPAYHPVAAADRDQGDIVGEQPLQQRERIGTRGFDLAHV
jgi:hypothetical protein